MYAAANQHRHICVKSGTAPTIVAATFHAVDFGVWAAREGSHHLPHATKRDTNAQATRTVVDRVDEMKAAAGVWRGGETGRDGADVMRERRVPRLCTPAKTGVAGCARVGK